MADDGLGTRHADAGESPGLTLWRVTNRWQAAMRAALEPHDLTHVQYVLLASLVWLTAAEPAGPPSQRALADFAAVDVMMTSQVVRALEAKGLLERARLPGDARVRALAPTAAGAAAARAATADVERADAAFFGGALELDRFTAELQRLARGSIAPT